MGQSLKCCCSKEQYEVIREPSQNAAKRRLTSMLSSFDSKMQKKVSVKISMQRSNKHEYEVEEENEKETKEKRNLSSVLESNEAVLNRLEAYISHENISMMYIIGKVIGGGHFGSVRIAFLKSDPSKRYAIKSIKKKLIKNDIHLLERELQILKEVDHPNIIHFHEIYSDSRYFHIVTELCTGGELFDRIVKHGIFSETKAAATMIKMLSAIHHLHERKICHRDLKPENFLYENNDHNAEIKLIDFGLSKKFGNGRSSRLTTIVGTPFYVAPEVLKGSYTMKCDMWSVGVILFVMLCGHPPFEGRNSKEIFNNIIGSKVHFNKFEKDHISEEARDLITKLLTHDPDQRYGCGQAMKHPWFNQKITSPQKENKKFNKEVLERLKKFHAPRRFQKEILAVLVNGLSTKELKDLRETFKAMDKNNDGDLSIDELGQAFIDNGIIQSIDQNMTKDIFKRVDIDHNGEINLTDFLTAGMDTNKIITKKRLWAAFKYFDTENKGEITKKDIETVFLREGRVVRPESLSNMMNEEHLQVDGAISFNKFCVLMRNASTRNDEEDEWRQSVLNRSLDRND